MGYVDKLCLNRCEDCGAISNLCWWDGEITIGGNSYKVEGLVKIDNDGLTFDLDNLIEGFLEKNGYDDYDDFYGEANCPFCKSRQYWSFGDKELILEAIGDE